MPVQPLYAPAPASALLLARKQLDEDTTKTWLLVALCAASGFYFTASFLMFMFQSMLSALFGYGSTGFSSTSGIFESLGVVGSMLLGLALAAILPVLIVIGANRAYKRQYDWITAEMVHGDLALMLVDESYGRMIQEWRESKYYAKFSGEVHLGQSFALRLIHFGSYAMQYFRMSQGQREFTVTPATPLNCWTDGIALGCLSCGGLGCLAWFTVFLPLRIVYSYPKNIAARRAALDYFAGKWEHAIEKQYIHRKEFSRNWRDAPEASAPAGIPPPP